MKINRETEIIKELQATEAEVESGKREQLWMELYALCQKNLKTIAYSMNYVFTEEWTREDYIQDVMLYIVKNYQKYDASLSQFPTWFSMISKTVYNKHYDKYIGKCDENGIRRTNQPETVPMYEESEDGEVNIIDLFCSSPSAESCFLREETGDRLFRHIDGLRQNYKEPVILCDIQGYKPAEAARMMGCKSEDISRWLNRAHNQLKKNFETESERL